MRSNLTRSSALPVSRSYSSHPKPTVLCPKRLKPLPAAVDLFVHAPLDHHTRRSSQHSTVTRPTIQMAPLRAAIA